MTITTEVASNPEWFKTWFNHPAYLKLYAHRSLQEAEISIEMILNHLNLDLSFAPKALDIACGAGRHAVALAEKNFLVVANDLSQLLLHEAKALATKKGLSICFTQTDMREIDYSSEFDLVVQLFTSFGYFEPSKDDEVVLSKIYKALKPNGWYVLDFFNSTYLLNHLEAETQRNILPFKITEQRTIVKNRIVKKISIWDGESNMLFTESVRLYHAEELRNLLLKSGFSIKKTFGDYDGNPFSEVDSPRVIFLAKK